MLLGRPGRVGASDYNDRFAYDAAGRITRFDHDAGGYLNDFVETFSYDGEDRLTRWAYDGDGSNNATVTVSYSGSRMTITSDGPRAAGASLIDCSR